MKRNIFLFSITIIFIITIFIMNAFLNYTRDRYGDRVTKEHMMEEKRSDQVKANEKYTAAQILSQSLDNVYRLFEVNLAENRKDSKNQKADLEFINHLTDILYNLQINVIKIKPLSPVKEGKNVIVPYELELSCDYEKFGKLITELDKSERLIRVNEFLYNNSPDNVRRISRINGEEKLPDPTIKIEVAAVTLNKISKK